MNRSLLVRVRDAANRYRGRFRYERRKPQLSIAELNARIDPDAGIDLGAQGGFARFLSAHLQATPGALWRSAPLLDARDVERVRSGEFDVLEHRLRITPETDWHVEPFSGVRWPRRYVETLSDLRNGSDLVLLWHLNKMKFVLEYASAYRTTSDGRFARDAYALIDSWCVANPYLVGMNWRSPLEAGTRLLAWSTAFAAFADAPVPDEDTCERIVRTIVRQADFVSGHFSQWDVPNNHLIGEAGFLFAFAAYWPLLKDAPEWMRRAEGILANEAERQILKDGFQYENSLNYHWYSLDFFMAYLHAQALHAQAPHPSIVRGVRAMADVAVSVVSPSGRLPMIGDDSVTDFFVLRGWLDVPHLSADGIAFESLIQPAHARVFEQTAWGRELLAVRAPLAHTHRFTDAGIDVVRDRTTHLVFTHGPQHHRLAAHGHLHADAGGFELELDDTPIFIDPGTFLYAKDAATRDHFRSAKAHNTLLVDGVEPMNVIHTFRWETVVAGEQLGFGTFADVAAIATRRKLPGAGGASFQHTRTLLKVGATIVVADAVHARDTGPVGTHWVAATFHTPLAPTSALREGSRVRLADAARLTRVFEAFGQAAPRVDVIDAPDDLMARYSRWYGDMQNGSTIRVSAEFEHTLAMVSVLRTADVAVATEHIDAAEVVCAVEAPGSRRLIMIRFEPFSVTVDGRVLIGPGAKPQANHSPVPTAMDWLDELSRGKL